MFFDSMNILAAADSGVTGISNLVNNDAATLEEKTQTAKAFFTKDNLRALLEQGINWAIQKGVQLIIAFIIWRLGKIFLKYILKITDRAMRRASFEEGVIKFINSVIKFITYAVLLLLVLDILGLKTASLVAIFGSAALALSMALQGSLANFAGGILIMLFRPFRLGDYIIAEGHEGTVKSIDILYTKILTFNNELVMMPNGTLSNSNIVNVGIAGIRRLDIRIGISYKSDIEKARQALENVMKGLDLVIKDKPIEVYVREFQDSSVLLQTQCWVKHSEYMNAKYYLNENYKKALEENGVSIPFPQLDVHFDEESALMTQKILEAKEEKEA